MTAIKVVAFVDGFNLYHAINSLGNDQLKWVNLRKLCEQYAPLPQFELSHVYYFSSVATWRPAAYKRHREYLRALKAFDVTPVLGRFKPKETSCHNCGHSWAFHEEKETDVNIAINMIRGAFKGTYDRALLISGDSDLVPAAKMVLHEFPNKTVRVVMPVGRRYSLDLYNAVGGKRHCKKMKQIHLERSLLLCEIRDSLGNVVAIRPSEYDPPD